MPRSTLVGLSSAMGLGAAEVGAVVAVAIVVAVAGVAEMEVAEMGAVEVGAVEVGVVEAGPAQRKVAASTETRLDAQQGPWLSGSCVPGGGGTAGTKTRGIRSSASAGVGCTHH